MQYTVSFLEKDYKYMQEHLFKDNNEQAVYILCRLSETSNETRFIVREIIPVLQEDIIFNDSENISYSCDSFLPVVYRALKKDECILLAHSHLNGQNRFSEKDDESETKFFKFAYNRLGKGVHGSIVFSDETTFQGRIWDNSKNEYMDICKIRVIGSIYRIINSIDYKKNEINNEVYNRNILAFGEDLQKLLNNIHVGVVGCGGTGSCLIEELCRMGVGKITIADHDIFEDSNVTRMHGSSIKNVSRPKVLVMEDMIKDIGLNTKVIPINEKLDNPETAKKLCDCDIIFSCLDNTHFTRAILNLLTVYYYIPLIDMGIKFYSSHGQINDIFGRIDVVTPNNGCLLCREVVDSKTCSAEMLSDEEYEKLRKEGYAPELETDKVQTISYNTLIASYATIEMIQLFTNFKGGCIPHLIYRFVACKTTTEGVSGENKNVDCLCNNSNYLGMGDITPFLGISWRIK